jgi:hypothetical protein
MLLKKAAIDAGAGRRRGVFQQHLTFVRQASCGEMDRPPDDWVGPLTASQPAPKESLWAAEFWPGPFVCDSRKMSYAADLPAFIGPNFP